MSDPETYQNIDLIRILKKTKIYGPSIFSEHKWYSIQFKHYYLSR